MGNEQGAISVFLAEDHAVVRSGLRLLINSESNMSVIGEAQNGQEAVDQILQLSPQVVLMDVSMPKLNGLEACRKITQTNENIRILMLTMHDNEEYFLEALQCGAMGYVPKAAPEEDVLGAIRCVAQGQKYIHPSVTHLLVGQYLEHGLKKNDDLNYDNLTKREIEVLRLVAMGYTTKEIAGKLTISVHTVHNHRNNIMDKLDIHDRLGLLKYALKKELLDLD